MGKYTKVILCVDKDGWTGGIQTSIDIADDKDGGIGYRISGPKYNGSSKSLAKVVLSQRDAEQIRQYIDMVYPRERVA